MIADACRDTPDCPVIVVAASGRPAGARVLEYTARLALAAGARVVVAHVPTGFHYDGSGAPDLNELRRDLEMSLAFDAKTTFDRLGVPWSLVARTGGIATVITALAKEHDATLIVIGAACPGAVGAMRRMLRQSVPSAIIRRSASPTIVVPRDTRLVGRNPI
jgi:nucleotide-binding universal stress UspA family protein